MGQGQKFDQITYQNEYIKEKYDRVNLTVRKGMKEIIRKAAKDNGQSVNEYINEAIKEALAKQEGEIAYTDYFMADRGKR